MEDIILQLEHIVLEKEGINHDIAKYLLEYKGNYINLRISDIVRDTFVSTAAVTRFSQTLGISGFPELKVILNNVANKQKKYRNEGEKIFERYINDVTSSLDSTFKLLNYEDIIVASNIIFNANKVSLCCIGNNKLAANDFEHKLVRINKIVNFDSDIHLQYVHACNLCEKDVAIGLSYSGRSLEVLKSLDVAKKKGAKTIFLTSNTELSYDYNFIFYLDRSESIYRKSSITSRTSFQVVLDLLFLELYQNDVETFDAISENNRIIK